MDFAVEIIRVGGPAVILLLGLAVTIGMVMVGQALVAQLPRLAPLVAAFRGGAVAPEGPEKSDVDDEIALDFGDQLLGACEVAAMAIDYHSRVRLWNGGAEAMTGWSAEHVIGQDIRLIMPPDIAARHAGFVRSYLDRYRDGGPRLAGDTRIITMLRRDGHPVTARVRLIHLNRGSQIIFAWVSPIGLEG